ncbi:Putative nuclease HARBI1, partial [Trachymyrmex cornetzi]
VLAALNFFASGSYQKRVGKSDDTSMSQASVSGAIRRTANALQRLMNRWVQFPISEESKQQIKEKFWATYQFLGVIGVINGTHIAIVPPNQEREFS